MMNKRIVMLVSSMLALAASAQTGAEDNRLSDISLSPDTTEITTVDDIINVQQEVTSRNTNVRHFEDVWSRKGYFNIAYNSYKLKPDGDIPTGVAYNDGIVPKFKSDWGVSIQLGRSYRLHKKPIANLLQFNIDYTYIDLSVNHFKAGGDGKNLYDSSKMFEYTDDDETDTYYYLPWNLEKYEANYGMAVGPSVTVAPFNTIDNRWLHYFKLNLYYHIGYHISALYIVNDKKADVNQDTSSEGYDKLSDNMKISIGHGLMHGFGFNLSWKFIGLGYEYRMGNLEYTMLPTDTFSKKKQKFTSTSSRIYLQFRM